MASKPQETPMGQPRYSRTGEVSDPTKPISAKVLGIKRNKIDEEALSYAKNTQDGVPKNLLALTTRLDEIQKRKEMAFSENTTFDQRRHIFLKEVCQGKCSELRLMAFDLQESSYFTNFMLALIVLNSITMTVNAYSPYIKVTYGYYCAMLEPIFLSLYLMEAVIKIFAKRGLYFINAWDLFDFVIVTFALVDMYSVVFYDNGVDEIWLSIQKNHINQGSGGQGGEGGNSNAAFWEKIFKIMKITRVLRTLRAAKLLRLIKVLDKLVIICNTVLKSLVLVGSIMVMLTIFHTFFSVLMFLTYCEVERQQFFSTFIQTFYTLIQILTLDKWYGIYTSVTFEQGVDHDYNLFIFLSAYMIVGYFLMLNLFIAVLVDNFQQSNQASETKEIISKQVEMEESKLMHKIQAGMAEISTMDLQSRLDTLNYIMGHDSDEDKEYQESDNEETIIEIKKDVFDQVRDQTKKSLARKAGVKVDLIESDPENNPDDELEPSEKKVSAEQDIIEATNAEFEKSKKMRSDLVQETQLNLWYYRLLASIEKNMQRHSDRINCHNKVIKIVCDDPEELAMI